MNVILDTDVASCLSKINGFDIIFKLFPNSKFFIPTRVFEELKDAEELGFRFVRVIFALLGEYIGVAPVNEEEIRDYERINRIGKFGYGEKACIAICRNRDDFILLSNDGHVNKKSRELGISVSLIREFRFKSRTCRVMSPTNLFSFGFTALFTD